MEEVPCRTSLVPLAFPRFVLCLLRVEREGLLDYQGRAGIMSIVRWNLRPVIFGVDQCYVEQKDKQFGGLQKGPAERGHVKKRQKSSKSVKKFFDTFRHFSRRARKVKNRQKVSKSFSTLFDISLARHQFSGPFWGGSEQFERRVLDMNSLDDIGGALEWELSRDCSGSLVSNMNHTMHA